MALPASIRREVHPVAEFLVAGAGGQLGSAFMAALGDLAVGMDLPELDVTDGGSVARALERVSPRCVINCSAITDVDLCQREPELAMAVHRDAPARLARAGLRVVTFSTDQVFRGDERRREPFLEGDRTEPANAYAESKLAGEGPVLEAGGGSIVVRTSWLFSLRRGMVPFLHRTLVGRGEVRAVSDQTACITYVPDLVRAVMGLLRSGGSGLYHLVNPGPLTPAELAGVLSREAGGRVLPVTWQQLDMDAPRPVYSALGTSRGVAMPPAADALARWRREIDGSD